MSISGNRVKSLAVFALVLVLLASEHPALAQQPTTWQTPQWIPGLVDTTPEQYPVFVTDPTGRLHVFHSQIVGGVYAIVYSYWTVGTGWAEPVDIVMAPFGHARLIGAVLSDSGMMHLAFWGGEVPNQDIYFTSASLDQVGKATAWSEPVLIGPDALAYTNGALVSDGKDYFVALYSGDLFGHGLYSVTSSDGGATWTEPVPIFITIDSMLPLELRAIINAENQVHAVWSHVDEVTGNSQEIFYSRLDYGEAEWLDAKMLARASEFYAYLPTIYEYEGELFVIFHNNLPTSRYMMRSADHGDTWTAPVRLFEHEGSNGAAALVTDSNNQMHMFFGNRVGTPPIHGLWHTKWTGSSWTIPEAVVSGPQVLSGANGEEGFDPATAQAIIIRGNLLFVVWRHDPMGGPIHIWYTYRYLDAPELPAGTLAVPTPTATTIPKALPLSQITPTLRPTFPPDVPLSTGSESLNQSIMFSLAPVFFLVVVILVIQSRRK